MSKFRWLVRFAILFSVATAASGQGPQQAEDPHLQQGLALFRQQHFSEALDQFKLAEQTHPGVYEIENLLGITAAQLGQNDAAEGYYRKAIALNPKAAGPHKNLGFSELNQKAYAAAEQELKLALTLDPHDRFTHYYLASLYLATAEDAKAVEQLDPARTLLENDPDNEFLMAKACLKTSHTAQALGLIRGMEARSQLTTSQNYEFALLLVSRRMYPEAVERFQYALVLQPQSWAVQYDLAIAWMDAGKPDKAITLLEPLATSQPSNASVLTSLGSAYEAADQLPKALGIYRKAVAADPQNPDRYLDYTRLLMDLDRYDEATKIVEQGIQGSNGAGDEYTLDVRLGVLEIKQGKYDDARLALNKAISLHPEIVLGYIALAQSYMQQGRDEDALQPLVQARAVIPKDATLEYYLGLVSFRLGHNTVAEASLKSSIQLRPQEPEPHYELGKLYFQQNELEPARSEFEKVVALDPANSNAVYQLCRIYARLGDQAKSAQMANEAKRLMQSQREAALTAQKARTTQFQQPAAN